MLRFGMKVEFRRLPAASNPLLGDRLRAVVEETTRQIYVMSRKMVPVDTGELRDSCRMRIETSEHRTVGWVTYSKVYAVRVHEDLSIQHPIHSRKGVIYNCGGTAKFLEVPMRRAAPYFRNATQRAIKLR